MGNEAGEWIIHGVKWNDPKCIQDVDEAVEYINRVGFLPLFKNEIPGFSLEERTVAEYWWSDDPVRDPWRWRIAIAKKHDILYGKFFAKKAGFISKKWLPVFANYCRDGYDHVTSCYKEDPAGTRRYPSDRCRTSHWTVRTRTGTGYMQMGISPVKKQGSGHQCKGSNCFG